MIYIKDHNSKLKRWLRLSQNCSISVAWKGRKMKNTENVGWSYVKIYSGFVLDLLLYYYAFLDGYLQNKDNAVYHKPPMWD